MSAATAEVTPRIWNCILAENRKMSAFLNVVNRQKRRTHKAGPKNGVSSNVTLAFKTCDTRNPKFCPF